MTDYEKRIQARADDIRRLLSESGDFLDWFEAANLSLALLNDTVVSSHPLVSSIRDALEKGDYNRALSAARAVVRLHDSNGLSNPRLEIAHEIEGDLLAIAQQQVEGAERVSDSGKKTLLLAVAAFLAGAALEDGLRRLCESSGLAYDAQK